MPLPLFPSFVVAGFECSTPINRYGRRIDELALTQHDRHVRQDYRLLRELGILAARDGVRWNLIDRRGRLDFSSVLPFLAAAEAEEITIIWDLSRRSRPIPSRFYCPLRRLLLRLCAPGGATGGRHTLLHARQ
jgi:hypothetical protein